MNENQKRLQSSPARETNLWGIVRLLLSKFYWLLLFGLLFAALVYGAVRLFVTPIYESRVSFYVYNSSDAASHSGTINNNDLQAAESLATTYSKILESNSVMDAVLEELDSGITRKDLSKMVRVAVIKDTQLLEVVVSSADPEFACRVASAFAKVAPTEIVRITKAGGVEVVDRPEVATEKSSPRTLFDTAVGFVLGVIIMSIILVLKTLSDTTVYLPEDIEHLGVTILGQIPEINAADNRYEGWKVVKGGVIRYETQKDKAADVE